MPEEPLPDLITYWVGKLQFLSYPDPDELGVRRAVSIAHVELSRLLAASQWANANGYEEPTQLELPLA